MNISNAVAVKRQSASELRLKMIDINKALDFTNKNRCATSGNNAFMQRIYNNHHNKLLKMRELLKEYHKIESSLRDDVIDSYATKKGV